MSGATLDGAPQMGSQRTEFLTLCFSTHAQYFLLVWSVCQGKLAHFLFAEIAFREIAQTQRETGLQQRDQ